MCIFSICQVVEGPFLKSGFSSLLRRVDINIKIGSRNDLSTTHDDFFIKYLHFLKNKSTKRQGCVPSAKIQFWKTTFKNNKCPKRSFSLKWLKMMVWYEKRSTNMILLVPYIPLAPKIPIESGSNSNLEPPPPVRTSDRYDYLSRPYHSLPPQRKGFWVKVIPCAGTKSIN